MKGTRRRVIELFLLVVGLLILRIDDVSGAESFQPGPGGIVWQDRVLPLPQEMAIADAVQMPAGAIRFEIVCAEPDAAPLATARELLGAFALGDDTASGLVVSLLDRDAAADRVPESVLNHLATLPNADQAYIIVSDEGAGDAPARLTLVGNTPVGMVYAARTLHQLILPSDDTRVAPDAVLSVPRVTIADWPDLEQRGEWGGAPIWNLDWYFGWKLNAYPIGISTTLDAEGGLEDVSLSFAIQKPDRFFAEAARLGYRLTPRITHIGEVRNWLDHPAFMRAMDADGNAREKGFCWSQPAIGNLLTAAMRHMAKWAGEGSGIGIVLTEGGEIDCHCEACGGDNGYIMETRGVLEAWRRAKEFHPDLHLWVTLSQGTRSYKANERILAMLKAVGAGVRYYDGHLTYVTDRKPMIFPELETFAREGGRVDVVPHLVPHFGAPFPGSMPHFVQFRLQEFVDKQLVAICAFTERDRRWFEVNMAALGEYAWNAHGRSPQAFARAFAQRTGTDTPERFARWADAAGEAAWELAVTRFIHNLSMGWYNRAPTIEDETQFAAAVEHAGTALAIARESGVDWMIRESDATLAALRAIVAMRTLMPLMRSPDNLDAIRDRLLELDRLAHAVRARLYDWEAANVERLKREVVGRGDWYWVHPLWNLGSTGIPPRQRSTAFGLMRAVDGWFEQALLMGMDDSRGVYAPVEIGEWTPADFDGEGKAVIEMDLTAIVPETGGDWIVGFHHLVGPHVQFGSSHWGSADSLQLTAVDSAPGTERSLPLTFNPRLQPFTTRFPQRHTVLGIPERNLGERLILRVMLEEGGPEATGYVTIRAVRAEEP